MQLVYPDRWIARIAAWSELDVQLATEVTQQCFQLFKAWMIQEMFKSVFDHKKKKSVFWFFSPPTRTSVVAPLISSLSLKLDDSKQQPLAGAAPRSTTSPPHLASGSSPLPLSLSLSFSLSRSATTRSTPSPLHEQPLVAPPPSLSQVIKCDLITIII